VPEGFPCVGFCETNIVDRTITAIVHSVVICCKFEVVISDVASKIEVNYVMNGYVSAAKIVGVCLKKRLTFSQ
jgi:hypothetical protein